MNKLFVMMSFLCVSHQVMCNPFQILLLMPGRTAAVVAYIGNKAGLVSDEASRPIAWLHKNDSLRSRWFYEDILANIDKKLSRSHMAELKKKSNLKLSLLPCNLQIKLEKIGKLQDQLKSFSEKIGLDNHLTTNIEAINFTLDIASKNITELQELRNRNLTHEFLSEFLQDQDFQLWFNGLKNNADLLSKVQQERDVTLDDISSCIIDDKTLQSLESRITGLIQAPKLDFSTHVSLAKHRHKKEAHQYLSAVGTYTVDLCACKKAEDYITIGAGGLGLLGFMSLMSKNNSEISKVAYVGCGGATSLIAKKLYYQFLVENEENIGSDGIKINLNLVQSRLENLRRHMDDTISRMRSELKKEFEDSIRDARSTRIEHGVDEVKRGVSHLQAGQVTLQSTITGGFEKVEEEQAALKSAVTDGFERNEAWQQQQLNQTDYLQKSMFQLKDQIGGLDGKIEELQQQLEDQISDLSGDMSQSHDLLQTLSEQFNVSQDQFREWVNAGDKDYNEFKAMIFKNFSSLERVQLQLLMHSSRLLYLAEGKAQKDIAVEDCAYHAHEVNHPLAMSQKAIENSSHSTLRTSIVTTKIDTK